MSENEDVKNFGTPAERAIAWTKIGINFFLPTINILSNYRLLHRNSGLSSRK